MIRLGKPELISTNIDRMNKEAQATLAGCMRLAVKTKGAITYTEAMCMSFLERSMSMDIYNESVEEILKIKGPKQVAITI